jgi:hypothetical protein
MKRITDKQRLDFLAAQHYTRWVGYDSHNGTYTWPVFANNRNLRDEIDKAIRLAPPTQKRGN